MWNKMADIEQVFRDEDNRRAVLLNIFGNVMMTMKSKALNLTIYWEMQNLLPKYNLKSRSGIFAYL